MLKRALAPASSAATGRDELATLIAEIGPADRASTASVLAHLDDLTKPPGSLGRLEHIALRLACLLGDPPPPLRRRAIIVFAADHGVARRGVSAYPPEVTAQMCATIAAGRAAICTIARAVDAAVTLVDVGVDAEPPSHPAIVDRRIRRGTADFVNGPALSTDEAVAAMLVGARAVRERVAHTDVFAFGELGIGNTTAAAALTAALLDADPAAVVGRGTGLDEAGLERKRDIVRSAVERALRDARSDDPLTLLAQLGGLEIAALSGAILAGAAARRPVLIDGFIATAAALVAVRLAPAARDALFAAHRSAEPGHSLQLRALQLDPLLELDMRLGEGTGAALALPVLEAAAAILREMATFSSAGVSQQVDSPASETAVIADDGVREPRSRMRVILVTGGARSGKSSFAQRLAREAGGDAVTFVATGVATDDEMKTRIERHRADRPAAWSTVEASHDAGRAIENATTPVVLLDCLTFLVSNAIVARADASDHDACAAADQEVDAIVAAATRRHGTLIVVTNEVGSGIVPDHALGRWFRDAAGRANQRIAAIADEVHFLVAGVPIRIDRPQLEGKGGGYVPLPLPAPASASE